MPRMAAVSSPPPWPPFQAGFISQAISHQLSMATRHPFFSYSSASRSIIFMLPP